MQHAPSTIEEQLILKSIKEECPWENLPKRLQATLSSKEEWHRRIIDHCIRKRIPWNTCFARKVCKEGEYYEEMMRYLRKSLALFPYHLADYVCRVMRISSFRYYCDMIFEVMRNEQPYDSIPNFSAADALRVTGIGRNEFIDIMNKCRSKKIMWKINKSIAKELLPTQPVDIVVEPWWGVCLVNFTLEEFKKLTEEEMATIDKICKEEANSFVLFDPDIIRGLYRRGLIYFDVPVYPDDRFKVSRLEGFVSNREQSYEDPIEELLYAVFVVSSENATVAELASTLQADLTQLQAAASFACRLGWAIKMIDPASVLQDSNISSSSGGTLSDEEDGSVAGVSSSVKSSTVGNHPGAESNVPHSGPSRIAFVVDANITSYLMMGSISPGLKQHAVTLYEAGKLGDASIAELCKDLISLDGKKFEGELQEFANHAYSLRCVLECLQSGGVASDEESDEVGEKATAQVLDNNNPLLEGDFDTGGLSAYESDNKAINADTPQDIPEIGTTVVDSTSSGDTGNEMSSTVSEPVVYFDKNSDDNTDLQMPSQGTAASNEGSSSEKSSSKYKKLHIVNILRCESLAALAPATLNRLFLRDYDVVVSMIPLPAASVLPGSAGPAHFGPPSYSAMTPWMKLVLYTAAANGPLSIVLMKGQCLRMLPAPLAGCEKALLWSWDGSITGGLGGKFEGNLVNGNILLHCLNSMLRCSAVLVQPFSKCDLDESGRAVTIDIPLPLKNVDGSVANIGDGTGLSPDEIVKLNSVMSNLSDRIELTTVGYIRLLKLRRESMENVFLSENENYDWVPLSIEFGMPLFNPKLSNKICERVVSSHLLHTNSLREHQNEMQSLRKRLRDICLEYQATGATAKLFYQKREPTRESPRQLMNYASGRWNPFSEPSTPISGVSNTRLKLANRRQNWRTEILSFDGNILRSYALTPVYEAATRPIEESSAGSVSSVKPETDEADSKEVVLPGVNLLFDGAWLHPFDIGACLQARQPIFLIAEASAASAAMQMNKAS